MGAVVTSYTVTPTGAGAALRPDEVDGIGRWGDAFVFKGTFAPVEASVSGAVYDFGAAVFDGDRKAARIPVINVTGHHVTIEGGEVRDGKSVGIGIYAEYVTVEGVDVHDNAGTGIGAYKAGKTTIAGNHVHDNHGIAGITVYQPHDVGWSGSPGTLVKGNVVEDNVQVGPGKHLEGNGILLDDPRATASAQVVRVEGNHVSGSGSDGVLFYNIDRFEFVGNHVSGNGVDPTQSDSGQAAVEFRGSAGTAWDNDLSAPAGHPLVLYRGLPSAVAWVAAKAALDLGVPDPHDGGVHAEPLHFDGGIL